ncbi:MAG TPA: cytochrome c peroxidase [Polyangiaceae bacterium]|nr:cytochrome c peroxidase [Polyangiaceae bacterium]
MAPPGTASSESSPTSVSATASTGASGPAGPEVVAAAPDATQKANAPLDGRAALGRKIFFDGSLSEPPGTSCASCHDPAHGFAGNNGSTIGVAAGSRPKHFARRNTPSVLYLRFVPRFHFHWEEDVDLPDGAGGFFWDGRSDSLASLVQQPLMNPDEMNARDARQVDDKIAAAAYAAEFRQAFPGALDDPDAALAALGTAVEAFLKSDAMSPFTSRYDDYIRGRGALSPLEARGLKLFKDRAKGACDACHRLNEASPMPERSLFTDYGFEAVAVPRNRSLPANHDAKAFDLGLCERHDHPHMDDDRECGSFRTPSLRNVAVRPAFMHNGAFSKLRDVVAFYATRGTDPKRWYSSGTAYDDVPQKYRENVNTSRVPYDRGVGEAPRLDDGEIDAIVAFLQTLTDAQYR